MSIPTARPSRAASRLILGDCLDRMAGLADGSVDAIIADPPYGSTRCAWDTRIDPARFWPEARRLVSPGAAVVMFADMRYAAELVASNPKWFRYDLVWDKVAPVGFLNANRCPLRSHELMLVFGPKPPRYRPQKWRSTRLTGLRGGFLTRGTSLYGAFGDRRSSHGHDGSRFPVSIVRSSNANGKFRGKGHPTQKPVELMSWLVRTFTDPGMTVLDPVMGSGSTGVACLAEGRAFVGMELDPAHFATARGRIAAARRSPESLYPTGALA